MKLIYFKEISKKKFNIRYLKKKINKFQKNQTQLQLY